MTATFTEVYIIYTTVEAVCKKGTIYLSEPVSQTGEAKVLVTFLDKSTGTHTAKINIRRKAEALSRIRTMLRIVPSSRSLADEIIAERRLEVAHEK